MKLNIEIAKHERMASSGSSLLRSLQNESLPVLDLIVREAVQNSLDAALPDVNNVAVDFSINEFNPVLLNSYFESIGSILNERYKGASCRCLAIRDSNTFGLTGKLHYLDVENDDFGNLQKLVYEISKPQTSEGAGGSWGLGKTVYFRAGIGLVIYYSRILDENGKYASRLAATLVEDERKTDSLIQYPARTKIKRGIAWWGKKYKNFGSSSTCPITDQSSIGNILQVLGVTPYSGTATGTTIIIPYIDEMKLLKGIIPADDVNEGYKGHYYWTNTVNEYLKMAIQRWYTPRMSTKYERGPYLYASVDGEHITIEKMAPLYKIFLQLYDNTVKINTFQNGSQMIDDIEYFGQKVLTRKVLSKGSSIGIVSYARVKEKDLRMNAPDNEPNPYAFVGKYDVDRTVNPPLLGYIRKPGMIVNYEINGSWLDGVPSANGDEFIIALFVLNSENEVIGFKEKSLEEYIRKGEKSDHTSWCDWAFSDRQPYIVSRLKSNTSKVLRQTFAQLGNGPTTLTHSGLEKALADLLLPPDGFGKTSNNSGSGAHGGQATSHSGRKPMINVDNIIYNDEIVSIDFSFCTGKGAKDILIELLVLTETGSVQANKWERSSVIGKPFPFTIKEISLKNEVEESTFGIDELLNWLNFGSLTIKSMCSENFSVPYGISIQDKNMENVLINAHLVFERENSDFSTGLSIVSKGDSHEN